MPARLVYSHSVERLACLAYACCLSDLGAQRRSPSEETTETKNLTWRTCLTRDWRTFAELANHTVATAFEKSKYGMAWHGGANFRGMSAPRYFIQVDSRLDLKGHSNAHRSQL
jgi:hypothetical protein